MKIYDISQEVFSCEVYPGDPAPRRETLCSMQDGALYNLTGFSMCAHNGTHVDAPFHFISEGRTAEQIPLEKTVGYAFVAEHRGEVSEKDAEEILLRARARDPEAARRVLIKGDAVITLEAAMLFAREGLYLVGGESQSVGPCDAPMAVHLALLRRETVLLEGLRLGAVPEGVYFLCAAPLALGGADGAPCRAILIDPTCE
ncbi:MAG: cyclase family protein [Clostridia bacterium]|nr:cyclase family protein [Clostridia bacterium]